MTKFIKDYRVTSLYARAVRAAQRRTQMRFEIGQRLEMRKKVDGINWTDRVYVLEYAKVGTRWLYVLDVRGRQTDRMTPMEREDVEDAFAAF